LPKNANNYHDCDKSAFRTAKKFRESGENAEEAGRMKKWSFFAIGSGRERIGARAALAEFLAREASLVAQKSIVDYCHMKTRLSLNELTREKVFADAFDVSRRAGFAAVLADLVAVVEAHLRKPAGARSAELPAALARLYTDCLARFEGGLERDDADALERRLAQLQLAAPKSSAEIALTSGNAVFDALPIHPRLRKHDREPVVEGVRFLFMSRCQRLGERLAAGALLGELLDAKPAATPRTA
jgi:uncharacterized protein (DUF2267 family)